MHKGALNFKLSEQDNISSKVIKRIFEHVRFAKILISQRIRTVLSEYQLDAFLIP